MLFHYNNYNWVGNCQIQYCLVNKDKILYYSFCNAGFDWLMLIKNILHDIHNLSAVTKVKSKQSHHIDKVNSIHFKFIR